jgi:hypothetical protein
LIPLGEQSHLWYPHPGPQTDFCETWQDEVLYGGAAGGGKTDCLIMEAARYINYPKYHALLARRTFPQLQEVIDRTRIYYPEFGGEYKASEHRWYFPNGAKISMGHCQHDGDQYNFQGKEFQFLGLDEAGQFLPKQILYLFSRCRTAQGIPKRIRYATNPGGPAHSWLKDRFRIGEYPMGGMTFYDEVEVSLGTTHRKERISRCFIPAKLQDNPSLVENDPTYVAMLMQLPEIEKMRLLHGIWDAFEGQVFVELNRDVHGCEPFDVPLDWKRYRVFDWGYSAPASVQWWAIDYEGHKYLYREWYIAKKDEQRNSYVGLKLTASEIARGIMEREENERKMGARIMPGPADPSIWNKRRDPKSGIIGPSVSDEMQAEGISWLKADNDRILGKQQVHAHLALDDKGQAQFHVFNDCDHWWRTMFLIHEDAKNIEDVDTEQEDHIYDTTRYFMMFKPIQPRHKLKSEVGTFAYERKKYIKAKQYAINHGVSMNQAYGMVR